MTRWRSPRPERCCPASDASSARRSAASRRRACCAPPPSSALADDDGDGILILPPDAPLGTRLVEYLGADDTILDLGVTPNRGDCLSVLGIAREVAALTGARLRLKAAAVAEDEIDAGRLARVAVEAPDLCPRYCARVLRGLRDRAVAAVDADAARDGRDCGRSTTSSTRRTTSCSSAASRCTRSISRGSTARASAHAVPASRQHFTTLDGVTRELVADDLVIADATRPGRARGHHGRRELGDPRGDDRGAARERVLHAGDGASHGAPAGPHQRLVVPVRARRRSRGYRGGARPRRRADPRDRRRHGRARHPRAARVGPSRPECDSPANRARQCAARLAVHPRRGGTAAARDRRARHLGGAGGEPGAAAVPSFRSCARRSIWSRRSPASPATTGSR